MKTEKIISIMRKQGYFLQLLCTVREAKFKYSARFTNEEDIRGWWEAYDN